MEQLASVQQPARANDHGPSTRRLFFLDFIRALSVLWIIQYHFNIQLLDQSPAAHTVAGFVLFHQSIGDIGVTLFIMISGVGLMTSASKHFSMVEFYRKRFLAIFPSYWLTYVVVGCALFLIRGFWVGDGQHWKIILTILGMDGLTLYRGPNFYLIGEWFTGFILLMYVMFPLLRRGVIERPIITWVVVLALFGVLHRYYSYFFALNEARNPLVRLPEFVFGLCFLRYVLRFHIHAFCISVAALTLFLFWYPPISMQLYGILLGISLFCAISFLAEKAPLPSTVVRYTEGVSRYSFLAFLVHHQIIYVLLPHFNAAALTPVEVYVLFALVVVLSFAAARTLYKPVERFSNVLRRVVYLKSESPVVARATTVCSGWIGLLGLAVFASSVFGVVHFYSPVPFWDEWDGYIGFYRNITSGWTGGWWVNHSEHRIVTSRILYWLDINVFGGMHVFLFAAEMSLVAIIALVVWREYARGNSSKAPAAWVGGLSLALLFSWMQQEVLKWGFETQVIAAYMFALLSAAQFSRFEEPRGKRVLGALVFASLAEISMGNGLMTFPMLLALGIICRRSLREMAAVVVTWVVMWAIYFYGYTSPPVVHPPMAAMARAKAFVEFFFVFLGNPFALLTGNDVLISFAAGAVSFALGCGLTYRLYRSRDITAYRAFLIGGYGFVILSALAAMSGRAFYGPEAAMPSRYTTGPLLAWLLLALLVFDVARSRIIQAATIAVSTLVATVLASFQVHAADDNAYLYDQKLAILAHKIGADRPELDALLFPDHDHFSDLATFAERNHVALYGKGWLRDAGEVKYDATKRDDSLCQGFFDLVTADKVGPVLRGWATSKAANSTNVLIVVTNNSGKTIGYGLTGLSRPDVTAAIASHPKNTGWIGYATEPATDANAFAYVSGKFCKLTTP